MASSSTATTATTGEAPLSPDDARISIAMAQDRPTIDAAVKSFLSFVCARGMAASMTAQDVQSRVLMGIVSMGDPDKASNTATTGNTTGHKEQVLQVARAILQSCNAYEFPVHKTVAADLRDLPGLSDEKKESLLELSVVARLWNGLIQSKQKPTRFLGRKALLHAWSDLEVASKLAQTKEEDDEAAKAIHQQQVAWIEEFGNLLFCPPEPNSTEDNDSNLLWAVDGGQAELARRRQRRQSAATERGPVTPS